MKSWNHNDAPLCNLYPNLENIHSSKLIYLHSQDLLSVPNLKVLGPMVIVDPSKKGKGYPNLQALNVDGTHDHAVQKALRLGYKVNLCAEKELLPVLKVKYREVEGIVGYIAIE